MHWASESFRISPVLPCLPSLSEPVSQLQADFTLRDGNSGPTAELSCLASSGSPPIIYRLVGNDRRIHAQQRPLHGKPANFSIPLSQTFGWFHCEAVNGVSVESSARVLLPPGEKALQTRRSCSVSRKVARAGEGLDLATAQGMMGLRMLHASFAPGLAGAQPTLLPTPQGSCP